MTTYLVIYEKLGNNNRYERQDYDLTDSKDMGPIDFAADLLAFHVNDNHTQPGGSPLPDPADGDYRVQIWAQWKSPECCGWPEGVGEPAAIAIYARPMKL